MIKIAGLFQYSLDCSKESLYLDQYAGPSWLQFSTPYKVPRASLLQTYYTDIIRRTSFSEMTPDCPDFSASEN